MATELPSGDFGDVLSCCFAAAQPASTSLFPAHSFKRSAEILSGFPIEPATSGSFLTEEMTRRFCSGSVAVNSIKSVVLEGGTSFAAAGPAWGRANFFSSSHAPLSA